MCVWVFFRFFLFFLVDYFLLAILYIITLPQIVFFNFPFFFFLLGQLFVCFDFLCTPCSLSVTHYFFLLFAFDHSWQRLWEFYPQFFLFILSLILSGLIGRTRLRRNLYFNINKFNLWTLPPPIHLLQYLTTIV